MTYLTVLVFIANINGEDFPSSIPFTTEEMCQKAIRAANDLYDVFDEDWDETLMGCVRIDVVTGYTIRPKVRPWSK
jgi:hypothetical protein